MISFIEGTLDWDFTRSIAAEIVGFFHINGDTLVLWFLGPIHSMAHASATSFSGGDTINTWSSMGIDFQDKETLKIGVPWRVRDPLPQNFLSRYLVKIQCGLTFYDNQCPMLLQEDKIFQHQMHKWSFAVYVDWIRKSIHISLRGNQIHKFCHNHNE